MSLAITHFSIGVISAVIILLALRSHHHPLTPFYLVAAGCLAMFPDLRWVHPTPFFRAMHPSPLINIFFGHHFLDQSDPTDSRLVATIAIIGMLLAVCILCAVRVRISDN